jgi:outer membrane receptor protein involved in Fe transport
VLEQNIWGGIHGIVETYYWDIHNLISQLEVVSPDPQNVALQYRNAASAHATGVELELHVPLPYDIAVRATYGLQDARTAGGARLSNSPRHLATASVLFPLPGGIEGGAELLVVGPRKTLADNSVSTATIANLTLGRRNLLPRLLPGFDVIASFYNIYDQHYSDPTPAELVQDSLKQDGFTFRLQLRYSFKPRLG